MSHLRAPQARHSVGIVSALRASTIPHAGGSTPSRARLFPTGPAGLRQAAAPA
ncbi:MAG TPA: hypothetical protein VNO70_09160 [Blastocatellia bacterium]|nr:hypothetical protein [Blastocatellia bacterium]